MFPFVLTLLAQLSAAQVGGVVNIEDQIKASTAVVYGRVQRVDWDTSQGCSDSGKEIVHLEVLETLHGDPAKSMMVALQTRLPIEEQHLYPCDVREDPSGMCRVNCGMIYHKPMDVGEEALFFLSGSIGTATGRHWAARPIPGVIILSDGMLRAHELPPVVLRIDGLETERVILPVHCEQPLFCGWASRTPDTPETVAKGPANFEAILQAVRDTAARLDR